MLEVGWSYFRLNDFNAALAIFKEGLQGSGSAARNRRPFFQLGVSTVLWKQGKHGEALPLLLECIHLARRKDDERLCFQAHNNCGGVYAELGRHPEALEQYEQAQKCLERLGNRADMRIIVNNLGDLNFKMARYGESLIQYQKLESAARECNDQVRLSMALCGQAENQHRLGQPERAVALARRAFDVAEASGNVLDSGIAKRILGELFLESNETVEAEKSLRKAASLLAETAEEEEIEKVRRYLAQFQ
jgi:tetratricopeptide (TPR) repeat protein